MPRHVSLQDYAIIICGAAFIAFGAVFFQRPMQLVSGGVNGIAIFLRAVVSPEIMIWHIQLGLNAVLLALLAIKSWRNKKLDPKMPKSLLGALALIGFLFIFEQITERAPGLTDWIWQDHWVDIVIAVLASGVAIGLGLGLVISRGGATGGTDFIALIIGHKNQVSNMLFVIDGVVIVLAAVVATGWYMFISGAVCFFILNRISNFMEKRKPGGTDENN